jgi:competence protein ComEA
MPTPSKPQLAIYAAFAIAIVLIGARFLRSGGDASPGAAGDLSAAFATGGASTAPATGGGHRGATAGDTTAPTRDSADGLLVVDVEGAVRRPGVYRLPADARAIDAVRRAGGLAHGADRAGVNLAARIVDGGEVVVPGRGSARSPATDDAGAASPSGKAAGPLSLDLNTANEQQLEQLDGVGPATAAKIVAYRTQHGGIASVDELEAVPGIGPAKLAAIRAQLGQ